MKTILKLIFALAITILAETTGAQTFTASVDNTTVSTSDQFQITFTFAGKDINGMKNFNPPDFKGFMIISGPNQSTSMQFINGSVSASASYSYYLQAREAGKFTIGSARIDYEGKPLTTQPIEITVTKGTPPQASTRQSNQSISSKDIGDNLFILATADKQNIYLGEQVTVTYKIYTRLDIASFQPSKLPSYEGLWSEQLNVPSPIPSSLEMYNKKQYRVYTIDRVALFPSQLGELSVTPLVLDIPIQVQQKQKTGDSFFDRFFNDPFFNTAQVVNYTATSNTIRLHVIPLPTKGVPKSFNGAVGDYSLSSSISSTNAKTNEPLSLKFNLSGRGNIQLLNLPDIDLPPGFDKYQPKISQQIDRNGTISGTKTFEYLIVPRDPGTKAIPPEQFSYFSPAKKSYIALASPSYELHVVQGTGSENEAAGGFSKEEITLLGQDIRYIKTTDSDIRRSEGIEVFGFGFWAGAIVPLVAFGGLLTWRRKQDRLAGNLQLLRYQRAEKIARKRFKNAKALMDSGNQTGFYAEISQAVFGYLEDKLHIPKSDVSSEFAASELRKRNVKEEVIAQLKDCVDRCEFMRFAPAGEGAPAMKEMYAGLTHVVVELEKHLAGGTVKKNV